MLVYLPMDKQVHSAFASLDLLPNEHLITILHQLNIYKTPVYKCICCILGSGKTFTMMGTPDNPGLTPRICENLFARMVEPTMTYRCEVSYLEIYNERVRDLLQRRTGQSLFCLKMSSFFAMMRK